MIRRLRPGDDDILRLSSPPRPIPAGGEILAERVAMPTQVLWTWAA